MAFFNKVWQKKNITWLVSFLLPFLIFAAYFIYRGIAPFGDLSILTVDLGQQYVDFLEYFRDNIFSPQNFIYNFNKGLGGSFLGTFAYYLASPFNFLLFLFPKTMLPTAIFFIILTKIGCIGLASFYFFKKNFKNLGSLLSIGLSTAYALSGFIVTNHFNLMWLDSVILLPLLLNEVEKLVTQDQKQKSYLVFLLFLTWFTNFYTGYMAVLFTGLYFLTRLVELNNNKFKTLLKYAWQNILALGLSAVLLWPTVTALLSGKAQSQENIWQPKFEFGPENLLAKLISGSFNFNQMSVGMPNFYFGATLLVFLLGYFFTRRIQIKEKLLSFLLLAFLLLSCTFAPFILIWHLGQFPVWYPGRFTFALSLFCLVLIARYLNLEPQLIKGNWKVVGLLVLVIVTFVGSKLPAFTFLDNTKLFTTIGFFILGLLLMYLPAKTDLNLKPFLFVIILLDTSVNLIGSLNDISYQKNSAYTNYTKQVTQASVLNRKSTTFSRLEKTFERDNNDPISNQYFGITNFDSVSDKNQVQFLDNLGLVTNDSSVNNAFCTIVSDSLLGIKYYLTEDLGTESKKTVDFDEIVYRPDLNLYHKLGQIQQIKVYENPYALPGAFLTDKKLNDQMKHNQTSRLNLANTLQDFLPAKTNYFEQVDLPLPSSTNANTKKDNLLSFSVQDKSEQTKVTYEFTPTTDDPYYLSLPNYFDEDSKTQIFVNNHEIDNYDLGSGPKLVNVAANQKTYPIKITFISRKSIDLGGLVLYRFNFTNFKKIVAKAQANDLGLKVIDQQHLETKTFTTTNTQYVQTLIPANANWQVYDNGKKVTTYKYNNALLGLKLTSGKHKLTFKYVSKELCLGLIVSVIFGLICLGTWIFRKRQMKNSF